MQHLKHRLLAYVSLGMVVLAGGTQCSGGRTIGTEGPAAGMAGTGEAGHAGEQAGLGGVSGVGGVTSGVSAAAGSQSLAGQPAGGTPASGPCEAERSAVLEFIKAHKACATAADCGPHHAGCGITEDDCTGAVYLNRSRSYAEIEALLDKLRACTGGECAYCEREVSLWACTAGQCTRAEPGVTCVVGVDQTCNDSPFSSSTEGQCVEPGVCECSPRHPKNPDTGRCRFMP